ncbi:hypothetical protein TPHA_0H00110 [Tetrapisispora phaffii CBS 4417]|uniref:NADP-dependent oxidoreductase domain-containing protein n=1 Tax=Tetrapisispora phaffii (strain ATCC 24235 / CBS 4417 / NBRC 1672 / NRRL Y-8282 / UCD 70-5) TaxID=1071381 RepID=G8BWR8_TETPH|nr:hypothetical protein TPHA_0H00110 [Tetrapisispora phaffii CBS 4417]CCE64222.1 hypothetical protein TPHA_0H00110 [Tetrapisispora phaffii CBS 4417]
MSLVQQVRFGNTGLKISPIIIGCMTFGKKEWSDWIVSDKEEVFRLLKYCYDKGLRTYDTANTYSNGVSEQLLGEFLKRYNIRRETVVIMSKLFFPADDSLPDFQLTNGFKDEEEKLHLINQFGLNRRNVIESAKQSVERLGTYMDVLQIHRCDRETPFEETMRALNDVVNAGYTKYIGASLMRATEFAEMQFIAEKHDWHKFVNVQSLHNLIYREDERELIPFTKKHGIALTPYSPLQKGYLAKPYGTKTVRNTTDKHMLRIKIDNMRDSDKEIISRVEKVSKDKKVSMAEVSLAWLIQQGCNPIVGVSSTERVDEAIRALDVKLTEEETKFLEEPYQPQPQLLM